MSTAEVRPTLAAQGDPVQRAEADQQAAQRFASPTGAKAAEQAAQRVKAAQAEHPLPGYIGSFTEVIAEYWRQIAQDEALPLLLATPENRVELVKSAAIALRMIEEIDRTLGASA